MKIYTIYTPSHSFLYKNYFLKTLPNEFEIVSKEDCVELDFYPAEKFFWEHIHELKENK
jgi:hypothetical protein